MRLVLLLVLFGFGMFFTLLGLGFLIDPLGSADGFGLANDTTLAKASLRADMTAFFLVTGGAMIWGAWRRAGAALIVPAALLGIALTGRIVNLVVEGAHDGFWMPMTVEALGVLACLAGLRALRPRIA